MSAYQQTLEHIESVQSYLNAVLIDLETRSALHDMSKLREPELSGFERLKTRLENIEYGTEDYMNALKEAHSTISHHYEYNDHHPEYHQYGISDMPLTALIEMLCDWKAASERTKNGSMGRSLKVNTKRFNIDHQLNDVLWSTALDFGWVTFEEYESRNEVSSDNL